MKPVVAACAVKMHGAENAFVVLDERPPRLEEYGGLARAVCDPAGDFGGADGLLVVRAMAGFAAEMQIFNADGTQAEMCGNGVRCVARYLHERGAGDAFSLWTGAGAIGVEILAADPFEARVDIGPVAFPGAAREETLEIAGRAWPFFEVSLGNPHAVLFVDEVDAVDLPALGSAFNAAARFPRGTNVHVVQPLDGQTLRVRHYERGVGLTRACGTGAVACAAAAIVARGVHSPVTVLVPGGTLRVDWRPQENARLTGPAETVFERTLAV